MTSSSWSAVVQHLRAAAGRDGGGRTDGELLTDFLSRRDEDALAALVERHAPMVWGVCRRVLRHPHDAEDAFQATFLVLVQKAATVVPREMVANWLHGVAHQTAVRLRATIAKRGWREVRMDATPEPAVLEAGDEELLSRLDEELGRLPERCRALIVLCDLEGRTRKEAARQLGCPEGTVASGLARARALLAKRLTRRGLAVSGGSLAAALSHAVASAGVPASVVTSAIHVATLLAAGKAAGAIPGPVATLTHGVLKTMFLKKIMTTAVAGLALGVAVIAGGSLASGQTKDKPAGGTDVKAPVAEKLVEPAAKQEKEPFTAWGEAVGGVQAGLGFPAGAKRAYRHGEEVTLAARVRNVGKEKVKLQYFREWFYEDPPVVTDADGKRVPFNGGGFTGELRLIEVDLAPGEDAELCKLNLTLRAVGEKGSDRPWTLSGVGKYQLQYKKMGGNIGTGEIKYDPILDKLATGKLDLEVTDKLPEGEKKPKDAPADPKPEARKVYTPDEAVKIAGDSKLTKEFNESKSAVEFKVQFVTKAIQVKASVENDAAWAHGHSPDDVCLGLLVPNTPGAAIDLVKRDHIRFVATLTAKAIGHLNKVGITDLEKHFKGKTVRVTGPISRHAYAGFGSPDEVEIVLDDLSQLATGKLDLEVTDKPPEGEKKPKAPADLKPRAKKVYTPDELVREKYDAVATRTVEFKVVVVTKPTEIKQSPDKDAPWVVGHGPDDVSLLPHPPKKFQEEQFSAILTAGVVAQLKRIGIKDVGKHFDGKTIRISGRVVQHVYWTPGVDTHHDLVIDNLSQLEVVE